MAAPVRLIPALPPRHQSTEDRLAEMDAKIGHLIDGSAICSPPRTGSPSASTRPRCDRAAVVNEVLPAVRGIADHLCNFGDFFAYYFTRKADIK